MRTGLALLLLFFLQSAPGLAIEPDKKMHFTAGGVIAGSVNTLMYHNGWEWSRPQRFAVSMGIVAFLSTAKEASDTFFDFEDLGYSLVGGLGGWGVSETFNSVLWVSAYDGQYFLRLSGEW